MSNQENRPLNQANFPKDKMKTVSLVLGSGGARGLAHIGVIRWLEENDYTIESISGCSIGALIGGIYAAGKLDEFEHWVRAITKIDIVTLLDIYPGIEVAWLKAIRLLTLWSSWLVIS